MSAFPGPSLREIRVDVDRYVAEHGRLPRGRGSWAFAMDNPVQGRPEHLFWAHGVLYHEACILAKREAQSLNDDVVRVLP